MIAAILNLTRMQWWIARNTFWRGDTRRKIRAVLLMLFVLIAAWGLYRLMYGLVETITSPSFTELLQRLAEQQPQIPQDIQPYVTILPVVGLFAALVILLLTSFSNILSELYLSSDLEMLLVAPVPIRAVFLVKLASGLLVLYNFLFLLLGPALVGYGQGMGFGPLYFVILLLVLLFFPLAPASLGVILVMGVVRIVPARRAREIVGVLGALLGAGWYIFSQFSSQMMPQMGMAGTLQRLQRIDQPFLPSSWAGHALVAAGTGDWESLLLNGGVFLLVSVSAFVLSLLLAERLYYRGWARVAVQGGRIKQVGRAGRQAGWLRGIRLLTQRLPAATQAILWKDLRLFWRDLRNLQQLIFPLAVAIIWMFQLLRFRSESSQGSWGNFEMVTQVGASFFVAMIFSNALSGSGISREGTTFWLLKAAPVRGWQLLLAKWLFAYLPFLLVGTLYILVFAVLNHSAIGGTLRALATVSLLGIGTTSLSLGFGAAYPRLNWTNPQRQSTLQAGLLTTVFMLLYIGLAGLLLLLLPNLAVFLPSPFSALLEPLAWLLALVLTGGASWLVLAFGAARLEQMEM